MKGEKENLSRPFNFYGVALDFDPATISVADLYYPQFPVNPYTDIEVGQLDFDEMVMETVVNRLYDQAMEALKARDKARELSLLRDAGELSLKSRELIRRRRNISGLTNIDIRIGFVVVEVVRNKKREIELMNRQVLRELVAV